MTEKRCTIHNGQIILDGFPLSNEKAAALINELLEEIRIFKIKDERKLFSRRELERENKELKQQLKEFEDFVFSDEKILCYTCVNCISKGIYEVECSEKGKVDVHGVCFAYWKNEVNEND